MPIKKRSRHPIVQVIVRHYYLEGEGMIVTHQRIIDTQVRRVAEVDEALVGGVWLPAESLDPEKRGGMHYEVYIGD